MGDEGYFDDDDLINDYVDEDDEPPPPSQSIPTNAAATTTTSFEYDDAYMEAIEAEYFNQNDDNGIGGGGGGGVNAPTPTITTAENMMMEVEEVVDGVVGEEMQNRRQSGGDNKDGEEGREEGNGGAEGGIFPRMIVTSSSSSSYSNTEEGIKRKKKRRVNELDLYGFERFNGTHEWRTTTKNNQFGSSADDENNTMAARRWMMKPPKKAVQDDSDDEDDDDMKIIDNAHDDDKQKTTKSHGVVFKGRGQRPMAPDAQLVRYLNHRSVVSSVMMRKRYSLSSSSSSKSDGSGKPMEGMDSMPITLSDGTRVYVRMNSKPMQYGRSIRDIGDDDMQKEGSLLGVPMTELIRRSEILERKAERIRKRRSIRRGDSETNDGEGTEETGAGGIGEEVHRNNKNNSTTNQQQQQLWVDKHSPTLFSHLLSNERTNREVLRALRAWDPYVFGRDPPPRPTYIQNLAAQQQQGSRGGGGNNNSIPPSININGAANSAAAGGDSNNNNNSKDVRPDVQNRVILLSGPPGVGKTTLAHIIAKHAGYRPMEVNASDERSTSILTERVIRAMESATLNLGGGAADDNNMMGRPNCLILDEIDGADARSAITALVDIIKADMPPKGSKGKNRKPYLRRPIIFICNHKYAPALRSLLPVARQFDVNPPSSLRLVSRLRSVLANECMSCSSFSGGGSGLLQQLVSGSGGDIRSCLYALQFASARAREVAVAAAARNKRKHGLDDDDGVGVVDISQSLRSALGQGMKDERGDISGTISTVFRKMKNRDQHHHQQHKATTSRRRNGGVGDDKLGRLGDVDRVLRAVQCFGDNSKTLDCLFLNILHIHNIDPTLDKCYAAHEWLSNADVYRSHKTSVSFTNTSEHQRMQKLHIPCTAGAIHLLCRVETRMDNNNNWIVTTRELMDGHYQYEANVGLLHKFMDGLSLKTRLGVNVHNVVQDVIPYSLWLLSAGGENNSNCSLGRAVSSMEILNQEEKIAFQNHVTTMRALGVTYVKEHDDDDDDDNNAHNDNVFNMRLEPRIDQIGQYDNLKNVISDGRKRRKDVPSVLKKLLAHGANVEAMRERENEAKRKEVGGKKKDDDAKKNMSSMSSPPQNDDGDGNATTTISSSEHLDENNNTSPEEKNDDEPKNKDTTTLGKKKNVARSSTTTGLATPPSKRAKINNSATKTTSKNFLGINAAKAKAARTARKAAKVSGRNVVNNNRGSNNRKQTIIKVSNSGSGIPLKNVIRFKYQKGFTQAVRVPCRVEDLV